MKTVNRFHFFSLSIITSFEWLRREIFLQKSECRAITIKFYPSLTSNKNHLFYDAGPKNSSY